MATNNKYDRQLRLWGAAGQKALADTCVVLVRATAAGTETVKNLVLPGVGAFLVLDDCAEATNDYASNFFCVEDATKTRAQMAKEYLGELNPDVQGSYQHVENLMTTDLAAALGGTGSEKVLVVASDVEPPLALQLSKVCQQAKIPLLLVHSYGLIGTVRLQCPPLPLMNPKPRTAPPDLRLVHPFPALLELADSIPWDTLDSQQHGHVPYPLLLLRVSKEYHARTGKLPTTFAEKQDFQQSVKQMARDFGAEDNFREGHANAYLAYAERELDLTHLQELREAAKVSAPKLYVLLQGLDQFLRNHGNQPPLQGIIPDMTASTELYVKLQTIYRTRAEQDFAEMRALVPADVSDEDLKTFCQNVFDLDLLQTRSIQEEFESAIPDEIAEDLAMATMEGDERPEQIPMLWYLSFSACQLFYSKHGRYPGVLDDYESDVSDVQECLTKVVERYKLQDNDVVKDTLLKNTDYAKEMTRYGNAEIHNIGSVIGGVASQEAVKMITGQYVPLNNTYVYNGICSVGGVYKF